MLDIFQLIGVNVEQFHGIEIEEWPARIDKLRAFRAASSVEPTRKTADTPSLFFYIFQPNTQYLIVPEVSSQRCCFIPIGFMSPDTICTNTNNLTPDAIPYHFGRAVARIILRQEK